MTAQRSDKLIYKGNEYELASEPLNVYLKGTGIRLVQISTACHRGYIAEWLIEDDKLFLTDFNAFIPNKDTDKNWVNKDEIEEVEEDTGPSFKEHYSGFCFYEANKE